MKRENQRERYGLHSPTLKQATFFFFFLIFPSYTLASLCLYYFDSCKSLIQHKSCARYKFITIRYCCPRKAEIQGVGKHWNKTLILTEKEKHFKVLWVMPKSCRKSVEEGVIPHIKDNLDEEMN